MQKNAERPPLKAMFLYLTDIVGKNMKIILINSVNQVSSRVITVYI